MATRDAVERRAETGFARIVLAPRRSPTACATCWCSSRCGAAAAAAAEAGAEAEPAGRSKRAPRVRRVAIAAGREARDDHAARLRPAAAAGQPAVHRLRCCWRWLNLLPLGRHPALPDLLALVLVFWNVHQPRRVGVGVAFIFGLLIDVHEGALLGQHALAYTLLSFVAITIHRRLLWFGVLAQALQVLPLFLAAHAVSLVGAAVVRRHVPRLVLLLAPLLEALLWPWSRCCCWRRNAARPIRTRIGRCDPSMQRTAPLRRRA